MSIGLCCQYLEKINKKSLKIEYKNICNEKNLQYNRFLNNIYSNNQIIETWISNIDNITNIIQKLIKENYKCFRLSSNLFPLFDSNEKLLKDNLEINEKLNNLGKLIISSKMRLTSHPDQFCVISSKTDSIIEKSIKMLEHHAWVFDQMNLPQTSFYSINIHGGARGESNKLIESIKKLPKNVSSRLTLENDECSYSVKNLFKVYQETGVPVVFDSHHHNFNKDGLEPEGAFNLAKSTWHDIKPLTHLSNTEPELANSNNFQKLRQHSQYVHYIPQYQLDANNNDQIDIEFEFKMKNLAIEKAILDFNIKK